jgi:hypothetical protein
MQGDIHSIKIEQEYGHYVVHINGEFFCLAGTLIEAVQEVEAVV